MEQVTSHPLIKRRDGINPPIQLGRELERIGRKSREPSDKIADGEALKRPKYFLSRIENKTQGLFTYHLLNGTPYTLGMLRSAYPRCVSVILVHPVFFNPMVD